MESASPPRTVCFLCTGNYYRSRYAEEYFNHAARQRGSAWRAESRGLHPNLDRLANPGPMSIFAKVFLLLRGVRIQNGTRRPRLLRPEETARFDRFIALDAEEHRPYIEAQYTQLKDAVLYWDIKDLNLEPPTRALSRIDQLIARLLDTLPNA